MNGTTIGIDRIRCHRLRLETHGRPVYRTWNAALIEMKVYHPATGLCLSERVVLANTFFTRLLGLMFRRRLPPDEALWLRPCNGVHTFWMFFAIDVVFLDRDLKIVRLVENLRPFRFTRPHLSARSVLEMPANRIAEAGLKVGDRLEFVRDHAN